MSIKLVKCKYCDTLFKSNRSNKVFCGSNCIQKWHYYNNPKYREILKKFNKKYRNKKYKESRDRIQNNKIKKVMRKFRRIIIDSKGNIFKNMVETAKTYKISKQRVEQCLKRNGITKEGVSFYYYSKYLYNYQDLIDRFRLQVSSTLGVPKQYFK